MLSKRITSGKGQKLWKKAKTLIPGGNQLLSKRAEMFLPDQWPAYFSKAKGAYVWDLDGTKYLDMCIMGIGACVLGYADPDVNAAVKKAIDRGQMATLNDPAEVELAELLCTLHPWAGMVRYARAGGEAMAVAVRIARAYTGRDTIAFCGYHGWADWYLATNLQKKDALGAHLLSGLEPKGVPKGLKGTILPFRYNHIEELEGIVKEHPDLAAIVMEPIHGEVPREDFLKKVRAIADKVGAVLVFDEITMGFRMTLGGSHKLFGVEPDMAVFAKAMANGFAMAAILGRAKVMQAAQDTFISSTNWTESVGTVAALASIKKMKKVQLSKRLAQTGKSVRRVWESAAKKHGLDISITGVDPLLFFSFAGAEKQVGKTLFVQEMLKRGFLASNLFYASLAHTPAHVRAYGVAVDEVFGSIAKAMKAGSLRTLLNGPVAHSGFQRLN